jgi:site-specific recombinase XerC
LPKLQPAIDPAHEKQAARAAAKAAKVNASDVVEIVAQKFIQRHVRANLKAGTAYETSRAINKEIVGRWRGRRLSEIRRADIIDLLDEIVERGAPVQANRTFASFRRMCSWAIERGIIEASPCAGIRAPTAETARDRK